MTDHRFMFICSRHRSIRVELLKRTGESTSPLPGIPALAPMEVVRAPLEAPLKADRFTAEHQPPKTSPMLILRRTVQQAASLALQGSKEREQRN
jgi:hypothetical protein